MECEFPLVSSNNLEILEILDSVKVIAIVGLSPNGTKPSNRVAKFLQTYGYKIVPVYPKGDIILGEKVYRSLLDIPFEIDMVDVFRKPNVFDVIVDSCIERGDVKVFWSQLGLVNNEAAQKAKDAGMRVVQNHCPKIELENR